MMMPGREYQAQPSRFGFNGKENDNEVKGFGNQQDYGMRIYDTRLGRFLSADPIAPNYPMLSPYQFASNSPIINIDIDGLEGGWSIGSENERLKRLGETILPRINNKNAEPVKNQTAGLNLGFLKLEKDNYDGTTWWVPVTKASKFLNNSVVSGWNQGVQSIETSSKLFSQEGRKELRKSALKTAFKGLLWLMKDGEDQWEDVKNIASDVNTYEEITGSILLGKVSSTGVNLFPARQGAKGLRLNIYGEGETEGFIDIAVNPRYQNGRKLSSEFASGSAADIVSNNSPLFKAELDEIIRLAKSGTTVTYSSPAANTKMFDDLANALKNRATVIMDKVSTFNVNSSLESVQQRTITYKFK